MRLRPQVFVLATAASLALTACSGGSDAASEATDASQANGDESAAATSETNVIDSAGNSDAGSPEAGSADTADTEAGGATDSGDREPEGCNDVLTAEEIGAILGPVTGISGAGQFCNVSFESGSVGSLSAFEEKKADEAMDALLPAFKADATASAEGIRLDEDRGFVHRNSAVVRGDSGRVFRFDAPDDIDVPDIQAAMQEIAALLLTH